MGKDLKLTLDGDTFADFKNSFGWMINATINAMKKKEAEDAQISVKFDINLKEDESGRTVPTFKHKVTASMKYKTELSGQTGGENYELVWKEGQGYVMEKVDDGQQSFYGDN